MKLTIPERVYLTEYIPVEGKYATLLELRVARETLSFNAEEVAEYEIKEYPDGRVEFNQQKAVTYLSEIPMTDWLTHTVQNKLIQAEKEGKLPFVHLTIYEKFVINYNN
jgi:hypothetical protein